MARKHQRKHRRRRSRGPLGVLFKLLSILLILAAVVVGCVVFFKVGQITVTGTAHYTEQEIIDATEVEIGENLLLLNRVKLTQAFGKMPYIKTVDIDQVLPDTLFLAVTECVPVATVADGGSWWILDETGKLLERVDVQPRALIVVEGITPHEPELGKMLILEGEENDKVASLTTLLTLLPDSGLAERVVSVDLSSLGELEFMLEEQYLVKFPMYTDFAYKIRALNATLAQLTEVDGGILDLTSEDVVRLIPWE